MSGNSSSDQPGSYGSKGVASPSNIPGARYGGTSWRDNDGKLWIFGGYGFAEGSKCTAKNGEIFQ
jgi:hypothetical protein